MREITSHKVNGLNEQLEIVAGASGVGGAAHHYQIRWRDPAGSGLKGREINFQEGPIAEEGVNGVSNEALLAIVIDRLQGFQSGEFKCRENALALTKLEEAMHWLYHRTRERIARGVEGTSTV